MTRAVSSDELRRVEAIVNDMIKVIHNTILVHHNTTQYNTTHSPNVSYPCQFYFAPIFTINLSINLFIYLPTNSIGRIECSHRSGSTSSSYGHSGLSSPLTPLFLLPSSSSHSLPFLTLSHFSHSFSSPLILPLFLLPSLSLTLSHSLSFSHFLSLTSFPHFLLTMLSFHFLSLLFCIILLGFFMNCEL